MAAHKVLCHAGHREKSPGVNVPRLNKEELQRQDDENRITCAKTKPSKHVYTHLPISDNNRNNENGHTQPDA